MKLKLLLIVLFVFILGDAVYLGLYLGKHPNNNVEKIKQVIQPKPVVAPETSGISGKLTALPNDLDLFDNSMWGTDSKPKTTYYDAGTFTTGKLKDYKRIVAVQEAVGPGGPSSYIFATKDYKTYLINGDPADTTKYKAEDFRNPLNGVNKTKVTEVAEIDTIHPNVIPLDSSFVLFAQKIPTSTDPTGKKDTNGNDIYEVSIKTNFSENKKLDFSGTDLTLYADAPTIDSGNQNLSTKDKQMKDIVQNFTYGTTKVYAVDSTGLAVVYSLASVKNEQTYEQNKKTQEYPALPDLGFTKTDLTTSENVYSKYAVAFPQSCGGEVDTYVTKNLTDADFVQIGTLSNKAVFKLKSNSHPLYTLEYTKKIDFPDEMFQYGNPGKTKPTMQDYGAKDPIIFMKDFWGRWVVLGEYDYVLPGGCGKPVVYLYPTKPTNIEVKFETPIALSTQIPVYHNGWNVLAQPDGRLTDLQPQFTNCDDIDTQHSGAEYAKIACANNIYPYLYWSGNVKYNPYPQVQEGWVVSKEDLTKFIDDKLSFVGLTPTEKIDMESFWLPQLLSKNSPFYRISFLQTAAMNTFAPMHITPAPDSVFRIFLDYNTLDTKPATDIAPQQLSKVVRKGFTVVEWGGILK